MFLPKKRDRAHKEGVNLGRLLENRNSLEEIQRETRVEEGARGEKKAVVRGMETSGSLIIINLFPRCYAGKCILYWRARARQARRLLPRCVFDVNSTLCNYDGTY